MKARLFTWFLLLFTVSSENGCRSPEGKMTSLASFKGKSVQELLESRAIDLKDAALHDEPPGKLRELRFQGGPKLEGQAVTLRLDYTPALFSSSRKWDEAAVKQAIIESITVPEKD